MTIAVETADTSSTASGVVATFSVGWSFAAADEVAVTVAPAGDDPVSQVRGVDFDLTGDYLAGSGVVVFRAGHFPPTGATVRRQRVTPLEQPDAYGSLAAFDPKNVERSFDRVYRVLQEQRRDLALGGAGTGGPSGGLVNWADIVGVPANLSNLAAATITAFSIGLLGLNTLGDWKAALEIGTGGGGGGGSVAWSDITGKPTFGALSALDTINNNNWSGLDLSITNGGTGASTASNARTNLGLEIGANVQAYNANLAAIAGLTGSTGKIIEFTGAGAVHLIDTPAGGGGGGSAGNPPTLNYFNDIDPGGVATMGNDIAIGVAETSSFDRIWLPEGIYATTKTKADLTKAYTGPGLWLLAGGVALPGNFRQLTTRPTLWPVQGATGWFRGNQTFAEGEYHVVGPDTRAAVDVRYYESAFIPHHAWFDAYDGASGLTCKLSAPASTSSANIIVNAVNSADILGKDVILTDGFGGTILDTRNVVSMAGTTVTLDSPPSANHPTGTVVTVSKRTWNGHKYIKVSGFCEGDVYGHLVRTFQNYQKKPGQTYFFETSTVGQYGGDVTFNAGSAGSYGTSLEFAAYDQGNDVAYIHDVGSFIRNNDTGAMGVVWGGIYFQSAGAKPADFAYALAGKWRVGLDSVRADLTNFAAVGDLGNVLINSALGHRWVMNSTLSLTGRAGDTTYGGFYGNVLGDMFIESGNDGVSDFMALRFNRAAPNNARLRLRPTFVQCNVTFQSGNTIEAAKELVTNGCTFYGLGPTIVLGAGTGCWITTVGTTIMITNDGGASYGILRS